MGATLKARLINLSASCWFMVIKYEFIKFLSNINIFQYPNVLISCDFQSQFWFENLLKLRFCNLYLKTEIVSVSRPNDKDFEIWTLKTALFFENYARTIGESPVSYNYEP